jgi:hypothetical protein
MMRVIDAAIHETECTGGASTSDIILLNRR